MDGVGEVSNLIRGPFFLALGRVRSCGDCLIVPAATRA